MKKWIYHCRAISKMHHLHYIKLIASGSEHACHRLIADGLLPLRIRKGALLTPRRFKHSDLLRFTKQLNHLLTAGISLLEALALLAMEQNNAYWRVVLNEIKHYIQNGYLFSAALNEFPMVFPKFYRVIMVTADETGQFILCQNNVVFILEKQIELKTKIAKAVRYPLFLLSLLTIILTVMMEFLFPEFEHIYTTFETSLPDFTLLLFRLVKGFQANIIVLFSVICGLSFNLYYVLVHRPVYFFQLILTKIPKLGMIIRFYQLYFIFQHLAVIQNAGIPLLAGLKLARQYTTFLPYQFALARIIFLLEQGHTFSDILKHCALFPTLCCQYIRVAEETGNLEEILNKLSVYYQQRTENFLENGIKLIEPVLVFFLCIIIGSIVFAIYLPIAHLGEIIL